MSTLFLIYYLFWTLGIYPLGSAIVERPKDWRLYMTLVGMLGAAITSIFMENGV